MTEPHPGAHGTPDAVAYAYPTHVYSPPQLNWLGRLVLRAQQKSPRWAAPLAIAACFGGAAWFVLATDPTDAGAGDLPTCVVKLTTGLDCPGCGGTRAFYYLLHANLPEAARHHAMAVFAAPFLVWLYIAWAAKRMFGKALPAPRITAKAAAYFLLAWAVFSVARNLPFAPFTSLYV